MIGIFWVYKSTIFGEKQKIDEGEMDTLGSVDSSFAHVSSWSKLVAFQNVFPELKAKEYEEVPRGRVVFHRYEGKHQQPVYIVYLDKKLMSDANKQVIAGFFELEGGKVKWRSDPHYTTDPDEINTLFNGW